MTSLHPCRTLLDCRLLWAQCSSRSGGWYAGKAQRDTLVPEAFGEPVPDGSRDLPMVLLCAARIHHVSVILIEICFK